MSKVLFINGSPHKSGCVNRAMEEVCQTLKENGIESEIVWLGTKPMADCMACGTCAKTGKCVFNDQVNEIAARLDEFDGIVIGSPVYYGGANGRITSFMDRLFYSASKDKLEGKLGASIVSCRRGGATAAFERLNMYFTIVNMHVVGSQYWNQVHGFTAEDVEKDLEGLQTMRTLGQNMAWLLKSIEAGKENGVEAPVYEKKIGTHFIQ